MVTSASQAVVRGLAGRRPGVTGSRALSRCVYLGGWVEGESLKEANINFLHTRESFSLDYRKPH